MKTDLASFDLDSLKIAEHRNIEKELAPDLILQALEEHIGYQQIQENSVRRQIEQSYSLASGVSSKADRLCGLFRERTGWTQKLYLWAFRGVDLHPSERSELSHSQYYTGGNSAVFDRESENSEDEGEVVGLNICLSGQILQYGIEEEVLFQMGHAYARALDNCPPYHLMLKANSPVGYEQRKLISRLLRFQEALYACVGYLVCGCVRSAKRALFKMETGMEAARLGVDVEDLGVLGATGAVEEQQTEEQLLYNRVPKFPADPFSFYSLDKFAKAISSSTDRADMATICEDSLSSQFSKANEAMHKKLDEMMEGDQFFRDRLKILTQYAVAAADNEIRPEETQAILDSCDPSIIKELEERFEWDKEVGGNTLALLGFFIFEIAPSRIQKIHAAEILFDCIMTSYSDREFADEEKEIIGEIAEKMGVEMVDLEAIHKAVLKKLGDSATEEVNAEQSEEIDSL